MHFIRLTLAAAALAATLFAQGGPRGPQQPQGPPATTPAQPGAPQHTLDLSRTITVSGPITRVNLAAGVQHPSIVVDGKTIELAPVWWLLEQGLELKEGDRVEVLAAPCLDPARDTLFAIRVTNTATSTSLVLRSETGQPLWITRGPQGRGSGAGMSPGQGQPPAECGSCLDPASIRTATGTVQSVNAAAGIQMPTLSLRAAEGVLSLKIGPERILLESGFTIEAGEELTVRFAQSTCTGELVALSLTKPTGETVTLRTDAGRVAW